MMPSEQIILYILEKDLHKLKSHDVSDYILNGTFNSESGYHIYHVKMITELLLRELKLSDSNLPLSEKDIVNISTSSSLHDIEKCSFPKAF